MARLFFLSGFLLANLGEIRFIGNLGGLLMTAGLLCVVIWLLFGPSPRWRWL